MTSRQRFDRIEDSLLRIEQKLDKKASVIDVNGIGARVRDLEAGENPLHQLLADQCTRLQKEVNELTLHGSIQAQELLRRADQWETRLDRDEHEREAFRAVQQDRVERQDRLLRVWGAVVGTISLLAIIASIVTAFAH